MTEPKRLLDEEDVPESLRDALRSLEERAPSTDTVARVQRALQALPPAAAPAAIGLGWGAALFGAAVATVGAVAWIALSRAPAPAPEPKPTPAPALQTAPAAPVNPPASPKLHPSPSPIVEPEERPEVRVARPAPSDVPRARSVERPARHTPDRAVAPSATGAPHPIAVQSRPAVEGGTAIEAPAPDETQPEPQETEPRAQAAQPQLPEPEDEASLLYRAKRLGRTDPAAALRMIEAHTVHFPNGAYVEEREVLAIELHQRLGHGEEAQRRAARFLERFPKSVYRNSVAR